MRTKLAIAVSLGLISLLTGCSSSSDAKKQEVTGAPPPVYKVNFDTSRGAFVVEVHTDWAPYGSARFLELVRNGYFDNDRFFRVIRNFIVQFGINGDPAINRDWMNATIPDDPPTQHNQRGTLVYAATRQINSRSTQLFINLRDNSGILDPQHFAPFGKVITGMEVVDDIYGGYGEMAPSGTGPDPTQIQLEGNAYLTRRFPHLDYIKTATLVK
ncbi:MAG TPA: peptidylprolyl isomerase [Bryobacteraceae bacterium]|nr:peptidylprolyl isomerase [Bryobacteraceae bacterium]